MNVVSGCSGIGGVDLGFSWTGQFRTICYIENDAARIACLIEAMREGNLDTAPIWNDFRTFDGRRLRGKVDVFHAGIPCQGHSHAGNRLKGEDPRNLWPDAKRIIGEMAPGVVVIENVEGLYSGPDPYGPTVASELGAMGYVVLIRFTSAAEVGASHERMRTFTIGFMANSNGIRSEVLEQQTQEKHEGSSQPSLDRCSPNLSNTESDRWNTTGRQSQPGGNSECSCSNLSHSEGRRFQKRECLSARQRSALLANPWETEPPMGREIDGISTSMDRGLWGERIKALGNAVVPQVAYEIGQTIIEVTK